MFAGVAVGLSAPRFFPLGFIAIVALLVVCGLKGTSPGGPAAWRELHGDPPAPPGPRDI